MIDDSDVWKTIDAEDLWIYDKLILSRRLGYDCGPAGVAPTVTGRYCVRPISNYRMMGRGSSIVSIEQGQDTIPDGYFWCELFTGRHLSFDYNRGVQCLAVEGIKHDDRTDRFALWKRVPDVFVLPGILDAVAQRHEWLNVETIGDKIIEAHLRYNDDFANHGANTIVPVWKEDFYSSPAGDRIGFLLK